MNRKPHPRRQKCANENRAIRTSLRQAAFLEILEQRTYLSLVPSLSAPLPATLATGQKTPTTITVGLTNTGGATIKGSYTVTIFAELGTTLDGSQIQLGQFNENLNPLKPAGVTSVPVKLSMLPSVSTNDYHLIAQITGSLADQGGDTAASPGTVLIAAPFVDLTDSVVITKPASRVVVAGKTFSFSVTITNNGNVAADGPFGVTLSSSPNANGSGASLLLSGKESPNLAPGASKTYTLTQKVPATFTPGFDYIVIGVDPADTFHESDTTNNTAVTAQSLAIVSPLPDVVGSYTPVGTIKKGPFKGDQDYFELHVLHQDTAGNLSGIADINSINQTFSGTVNAAGKIGITLVSLGGSNVQPAGQITHLTGTLNKKTFAFAGTFTVSDGESGTFACTLPGRLANAYHGTQTINGAATSLVITITADEPAAGTLSGTVDSSLGAGLAMVGTDNEATGQFNLTATVPNGGTPYTVSFVGVEINGILQGTVTENTVNTPTGTFSLTDSA